MRLPTISWKENSAQKRLLKFPIRHPDVIALTILIPVCNIIPSSHHFFSLIGTSSSYQEPILLTVTFIEMERTEKGFVSVQPADILACKSNHTLELFLKSHRRKLD